MLSCQLIYRSALSTHQKWHQRVSAKGGALKRSSIILARVLGYIAVRDLDPHGRVFFPDLVRDLVERYRFQKYPESLQDYDFEKGVEFLSGRTGNRVIQKLVVWSELIVLETRSNTNDSKAVLDEILLWAAEKYGIDYQPGTIKRYAYISDVTFQSDVPMLRVNQALADLAAKTTNALTEIWQEPVEYRPISLRVGHDPQLRKNGIAPFSIERRVQARFTENLYFSEAPLPTDLHWQLLEEFEQAMRPSPL